MIGRHCDGWIELIGVIRRDHCNVLQSKRRLLKRLSAEQGWSTGSAGVRDSSARSGVHDCTYPPHRSTCDQCRYFPSCTRGPPWISLFVAARCRSSSRSRTLQTREDNQRPFPPVRFRGRVYRLRTLICSLLFAIIIISSLIICCDDNLLIATGLHSDVEFLRRPGMKISFI